MDGWNEANAAHVALQGTEEGWQAGEGKTSWKQLWACSALASCKF